MPQRSEVILLYLIDLFFGWQRWEISSNFRILDPWLNCAENFCFSLRSKMYIRRNLYRLPKISFYRLLMFLFYADDIKSNKMIVKYITINANFLNSSEFFPDNMMNRINNIVATPGDYFYLSSTLINISFTNLSFRDFVGEKKRYKFQRNNRAIWDIIVHRGPYVYILADMFSSLTKKCRWR